MKTKYFYNYNNYKDDYEQIKDVLGKLGFDKDINKSLIELGFTDYIIKVAKNGLNLNCDE